MVLALDPWAWLQAGFWLSFVAVGVLFATDSGADISMNTRAGTRFYQMTREQGVMTLALTPLTLLLFGQVSLVGLAANALAIPWVTLVVTPLAMLGVLAPPLWDVAAWAIAALAWYLHLLATWPFASVSIAQAPMWAGAVGVLGGVLLSCRCPGACARWACPCCCRCCCGRRHARQLGNLSCWRRTSGRAML